MDSLLLSNARVPKYRETSQEQPLDEHSRVKLLTLTPLGKPQR